LRLLVAPAAGVGTCVVLLQGWGTGAGGGGVVVRADADAAGGVGVTAYRQRDNGVGGLEDDPDLSSITVKAFTLPLRGNFEDDGKYIAVQVGDQWYAETGPRTRVKGKLDGALTFGGSQTLSIWRHSGVAEVDTNEDITVYDWLLASGQTIASGRKVVAVKMETATGFRWYVISSECP
jgi:hypothetical protein